MKVNYLILIFIFILFSSLNFADLEISYPIYGDVGETERIRVHDSCDEEYTYRLLSPGISSDLTCADDNQTYYIDITNSVEANDNFQIIRCNETNETYYNYDSDSDGGIIVDDQTIKGFNYTCSFCEDIPCFSKLDCFEIEVLDEEIELSLIEKMFYINGTESELMKLKTQSYEVGTHLVCFSYDYPPTFNYSEIEGFYSGIMCDNCVSGTPATRIRYEIKESPINITNRSVDYSALNDTTGEIYYDGNYMIFSEIFLYSPLISESFTIFWREPFYVDISLYTGNLSTNVKEYSNEFQYMVLQFSDGKIAEDYFYDSIDFANNKFNKLFGIDEEELDTTLSFWTDYSTNPGTIKLYESGNYSLNLLTTKTKSNISWSEEFIYPQRNDVEYFSNIVTFAIEDEVDQEVDIYVDTWEISKFNFIMNIFKVILVIIVWIVMVSIITSFGGVKLGGIVAGVTLPLALKLIGVF